MPRQISDEEDRWLQQQVQTVRFIESIYNDPKLTRKAKALIKEKYPNLPIPDYDIEHNVESRLAKEREEREAEREAARRREEDEKFQKARADTQKKHGFTDEAMKKLEDMMVERNIGNYEDAAVLMAAREPKTSEPTYADNRFNFDKAQGFADIAKDPEAWGRREILNAIQTDQERSRNR